MTKQSTATGLAITLRSQFHNTSCRVRVHADGTLSARQIARVRRENCGQSYCECGGIHGPQYLNDGRKIMLEPRWGAGTNDAPSRYVVLVRSGDGDWQPLRVAEQS